MREFSRPARLLPIPSSSPSQFTLSLLSPRLQVKNETFFIYQYLKNAPNERCHKADNVVLARFPRGLLEVVPVV
jgi:hypothetical protein